MGEDFIMINILIVEDSEVIANYLSQIILEHHSDWIIHKSYTYETAMNLAQNNEINLFILDYELDKSNPEQNGYRLGLELRKMNKYKNTPVIFETSYSSHIFNAVNNLNCIYYLVKPYDEKQVIEMINKITTYENMKTKMIFQDIYGVRNYIYLEDIMYAKSNRHILDITSTTTTLSCSGHTLESLEQHAGGTLVRCHKSYLVNILKIKYFDKTTGYLTLDTPCTHTVPVGRKYYETILEKVRI